MNDQDLTGRALIIEDDSEIADIVAVNIKDIGLESHIAHNGKDGLELALKGGFEVIILDIMLPGMDGVSICSRIREQDALTPVLMLTAKAEEIDRVIGLEIGADDYMTKPFSIRELVARVRALLRRSRVQNEVKTDDFADSKNQHIKIGAIEIDLDKRKVLLKGSTLDLTVKEFELLSLFAEHPGKAYSRNDLLNRIWGYRFEGYEHTVNTHINRLRNKIETDPANPVYLKTVWGVGYRFAEASEVNDVAEKAEDR